MDKKRVLIVGGVAGGASCAARTRRLSEKDEIIIFERGPYVSFANCGLPYYVGNVIKEQEDLLVATPEIFKAWFNIEVRLQSEVLAIDRVRRQIEIRNHITEKTYQEPYDALVLSPGATPIRPPLPGIDLPGIFSLRTIPDSLQIKEWIARYQAKQAVVVGGGYIGMEMTENLLHRGLSVTVVEMLSQVMPLLDPEMVSPIHDELKQHGVSLLLNETVIGFEKSKDHRLSVSYKSGTVEEADLVILAIGVRPEIELAKTAGLKIGKTGGIQVDDHMCTSDENIWAVGDAVEVEDFATGNRAVIPLAGPANRQGRIAADVIAGRNSRFRGVQGTSVVGIMNLVIAFTGPSEKTLKRLGLWSESSNLEKIYMHPWSHAGYYPGAEQITLKLIFDKKDGRIISAQAVGKKGVEKRIDVISMAIQKKATVFDLEEVELCYAPQFGSAKDPVNLAGMIAANIVRGDVDIAHWQEIEKTDALILDVREPSEFKDDGHVEGASNMPLEILRDRMGELPRDREIWPYCVVGQRSYYATRVLIQNGYNAKNLSGGFISYSLIRSAEK